MADAPMGRVKMSVSRQVWQIFDLEIEFPVDAVGASALHELEAERDLCGADPNKSELYLLHWAENRVKHDEPLPEPDEWMTAPLALLRYEVVTSPDEALVADLAAMRDELRG